MCVSLSLLGLKDRLQTGCEFIVSPGAHPRTINKNGERTVSAKNRERTQSGL